MSDNEHPLQPTEPAADRPDMPAGYGISRDESTGLLPWSQVREQLASARNYWVGTTRSDGRPHVAPVWGVWIDDAIYFSTDTSSTKARNLAARPEVVVHLESGDDVVILEGRIEEVRDPATLLRFADAYEPKYQLRPDVDAAEAGVYRLRPRVALAWQEQNFPSSATRFRP